MQKWSPKAFAEPPACGAGYEPLAAASAIEPHNAAFRPEARFADAHGLLRQLSRDERAQIMELLDLDLRREHADQVSREAAAQAAAEAARREAEAAALARWQAELADEVRRECRDGLAALVRHTADLAVLLATKIVRREVAADPDVLVRALETVLYKVEAGAALTVTVHPDDAAWLAAAPELRERLRIGEIKEDRRLERGGCLVKAADLEWDATIERQLAVLGETLDEALAVPPDPAPEPEAAHV